jgi:16S rRNA C1402 N4-methylase RsmH
MFEEYTPDLSAYFEAWSEQVVLIKRKEEIELQLEELTAEIYIDCMNYEKYHIRGKPPSVAFVDKTWGKIGHTPDAVKRMSQIKLQLIEIDSHLSHTKAVLKTEEMRLNLFQTMSANARNVAGFTDYE